MTVSIRMNPLLEKELEMAAKRMGITKSQFIISAVEHALGRTDPASLYSRVMEEAALYQVGSGPRDDHDLAGDEVAVKRQLRTMQRRHQDEYAALLEERRSADKDPV